VLVPSIAATHGLPDVAEVLDPWRTRLEQT
jgi:hypothetical protein